MKFRQAKKIINGNSSVYKKYRKRRPPYINEDGNSVFQNDIVEQKPADNAEPKFHEGDWVVYCNEDVDLITSIEENGYCINNSGYIPFTCANDIRLWTIQDAKDGDVLCCESGWTCIFKTLNSDNMSFSSYCFMDNTGWFCKTGSKAHTLEKAFIKAYNGNIYPATKEQRDTLMKAMANAGYTFDFESKELKEIEHKPAEWSEYDEKFLLELSQCCDLNKTQVQWLISLKDRVQPRSQWKPSDEQMGALWDSIKHNLYLHPVLKSLYNDLKKLKG